MGCAHSAVSTDASSMHQIPNATNTILPKDSRTYINSPNQQTRIQANQIQYNVAEHVHKKLEIPVVVHLTAEEEKVLHIMDIAFQKNSVQLGYTDGHFCITELDRHDADRVDGSLLYGEILPPGVSKLLDEQHLNIKKAKILLDLGCGLGKLIMQAFIQFPNVLACIGVELARSRFSIAYTAASRLVEQFPSHFVVDVAVPGAFIRIKTISSHLGKGRTLEYRRGNMWVTRGINHADCIILHTELPDDAIVNFKQIIAEMKNGARFVTYQNVATFFCDEPRIPIDQIPANFDESDTFVTSWSATRGHHLFCWEKKRSYTVQKSNDLNILVESKDDMF